MNIKSPPQYQSYMLRCAETRGDDTDHPAIWRFSLQDPQSGEKQYFADLESLIAFLENAFSNSEALALNLSK